MAPAREIIKLSVDGIAQIESKLDRLPQRLRNKAVRRGMTKAARILLKEMKVRVPKDSGSLRRSLKYIIRTPNRMTGGGRRAAAGYPYAILGPSGDYFNVVRRRGKWGTSNQRARPVNYEHLLDGGAKPHQIFTRNGKPLRKDIMHPGTTALRYRRAAAEAVRQRCLSVLADEIQTEINRTLAARGLASPQRLGSVTHGTT